MVVRHKKRRKGLTTEGMKAEDMTQHMSLQEWSGINGGPQHVINSQHYPCSSFPTPILHLPCIKSFVSAGKEDCFRGKYVTTVRRRFIIRQSTLSSNFVFSMKKVYYTSIIKAIFFFVNRYCCQRWLSVITANKGNKKNCLPLFSSAVSFRTFFYRAAITEFPLCIVR